MPTERILQARAFLDLARVLVMGSTEAYWRAAAVHGYYALLLECRDAQLRWGLPPVAHHGIHATVRLRFTYATDLDLKDIGNALDVLGQLRSKASYNLKSSATFASPVQAQQAVQEATAALALLARIDTDPVRRATAIATIRP